jgi:hypothetical protein
MHIDRPRGAFGAGQVGFGVVTGSRRWSAARAGSAVGPVMTGGGRSRAHSLGDAFGTFGLATPGVASVGVKVPGVRGTADMTGEDGVALKCCMPGLAEVAGAGGWAECASLSPVRTTVASGLRGTAEPRSWADGATATRGGGDAGMLGNAFGTAAVAVGAAAARSCRDAGMLGDAFRAAGVRAVGGGITLLCRVAATVSIGAAATHGCGDVDVLGRFFM